MSWRNVKADLRLAASAILDRVIEDNLSRSHVDFHLRISMVGKIGSIFFTKLIGQRLKM